MKRETVLSYLALAFICIAWGTTYLALRIGVLHFPPFLYVIIRQVIAGVLLTVFALLFSRAALPDRRELIRLMLAGLFMFSLANGLIAWAEVHVSSSIAAIICSFVPVWVVLMNLTVNSEERPNLPILAGTVLGLAGIVIIFGDDLASFADKNYLTGIILIFVATFSWSSGTMWLKKNKPRSGILISTGLQMLFGGLWLVPVSLFLDDYSQVSWSAEAGYSLIYLVFVGSIMAYLCYFFALEHLSLTVLSLYAYVNPLVAVILGWMILGERLNVHIALGFLTTLIGIYLVNKGYFTKKTLKPQLSP